MKSVSERFSLLSSQQRDDFAARLQVATETVLSQPIAIVGMACRLPGGIESPDGYWRLLEEGRSGIRAMPDNRWAPLELEESGLDATTLGILRHGGYLDDVAGFDAGFFGISPREANFIDPHHRMILELSWEALENAGIPPSGLAGSQTGVFMGLAMSEYLHRATSDIDTIDAYASTGGLNSAGVGRLSYLLDLRGPSVAIDTACSSSLVAVQSACLSLQSRESDLALAGGANILHDPGLGISLARFGMFAPDFCCKTFDAAADGYVRAEGGGVVVLKRLDDAIRDDDVVLAVIRACLSNQDGRSNGLTAPSGPAQRSLLRDSVRRAGVSPAQVGLVETHGTGTPLGDPIEIEALAAVYGSGGGRCALGAFKTNLGHTEVAAGVTGLIKTVLALRHGKVPRNLNFTQLNPDIRLEGTRFFVPTETTDWPVPEGPRLAAVSCFGVGGTNTHAIVEEAPAVRQRGTEVPLPVLTLSGASPEALTANADRLVAWLEGPEAASVPLGDVGYTLSRRRTHLPERLAVVATDRAAVAEALRRFAAGTPEPRVVSGSAVSHSASAGAVWVFGGHGSHWTGMGKELLATEPAFSAVVDELEPVFTAEAGFSLREFLDSDQVDHAGIARAQPAVFAVQVGLAAVWRSYGVQPAAVLGHSMGEVAAAVVAGALSPADGARVICRRSMLIENNLAGTGTTALVELPVDEVRDRLAGRAGVWIAVHVSLRSTVVSGDTSVVRALVAEWTSEGLMAQEVKGVEFAAHSPHLDPLLPTMTRAVADVVPTKPELPFYTTALDDPRTIVSFAGDYWAANLRNPVRFMEAVLAAAEDEFRIFVEISPHPIVSYSVREILAQVCPADTLVVGWTRRNEPERISLRTSLGALHCHGAPVNWSRLYPIGNLVALPTYAWRHHRYWIPAPRDQARVVAGEHPLLGVHIRVPGPSVHHVWQAALSVDRLRSWMSDHGTGGAPTMPAAGYGEMALAAACAAFGTMPAHVMVEDLAFRHFLPLDAPITVTTTLAGDGPDRAVVEIRTGSDSSETVHASARVTVEHEPVPPRPVSLEALRDNHPRMSGDEEFYERLRLAGALHGPASTAVSAFATPEESVADSAAAATTALSWLRPPAGIRAGEGRLRAHPAMVDGCLETIAALPGISALLSKAGRDGDSGALILVSVSSLRCFGDPLRGQVCHARMSTDDGSEEADDLSRVAGHAELYDGDGRVLLLLDGVRFTFLSGQRVPRTGSSVAGQDSNAQGILTKLQDQPEGSARQRLVESYLADRIATVLRMDGEPVKTQVPIATFGLDSLTILELRGHLEADLGIKLPTTILWAHPNLAALASDLAGRISIGTDWVPTGGAETSQTDHKAGL